MKIGILTFHDTNNFGSLLQTYALWRAVKDMRCEAEVIDYQCKELVRREVPPAFSLFQSPRALAKDLIFGPSLRRKYASLHKFLTQHITLSPRCDASDVAQVARRYDRLLIGSDIVWSLRITGRDMNFFLAFENDPSRKCAFAASVGDRWTEEECRLVAPSLSSFRHIAVRETQSARWVEEVLGAKRRPDVVCDPTMLLPASEWLRFATSRRDAGRYVLVYFDADGHAIASARQYAREHGLRVYHINYGLRQEGVCRVRPETLGDFLGLVSGAAAVFTASYHGMLFSLYFHRPFVWWPRAQASRMLSLAERLDVGHCNGTKLAEGCVPPVDWEHVEDALQAFRECSLAVLEKMCER